MSDLVTQLASMIERHKLYGISTAELKSELARRGESLPQQEDLREPLSELYERANELNESLNSGNYDDSVRAAMEVTLGKVATALIRDFSDSIDRKAQP